MECSEKETIKSNVKAARILKAYLKERYRMNILNCLNQFGWMKFWDIFISVLTSKMENNIRQRRSKTWDMLQIHIYRVAYFKKNRCSKWRGVNVSFKAALAELKRIVKGYVEHNSVTFKSIHRKFTILSIWVLIHLVDYRT